MKIARTLFVGVGCPNTGRHSSVRTQDINASGLVAHSYSYECRCGESHIFTIPCTWRPKHPPKQTATVPTVEAAEKTP